MTYKLVGQEPYQLPSNADLGSMAYQSSDAIQVGLVNIANTVTIAGIQASLSIGYNQSSANSLLAMLQVPQGLITNSPVSGSNINANTVLISSTPGFAMYQPTYTATTASTIVALTSTYGISVGMLANGTGITYGSSVTNISNIGAVFTATANSSTVGTNIIWLNTTTNISVSNMAVGTGISTGTLVTSIVGASNYVTISNTATITSGTVIAFAPTVTLSQTITANTQTQNILFYPTIVLSSTPSSALNQGSVINIGYTATSAANAALVIQQGGLGVTGNSYFSGNLFLNNFAVSTGTSAFNGGTITSALAINNTTQSTGTTTGALTVQGGVGIGGNVFIGGTITASNITINGTVINTSSVAISNNTNSSALQYLTFVSTSAASSATLYVNAPSGIVYQPSTGFMGIGTTSTILSPLHVSLGYPNTIPEPGLPGGPYIALTLDQPTSNAGVGIDFRNNYGGGYGYTTSTIMYDFLGSAFGVAGLWGPGPTTGSGSWGMNYVSGRPYFGYHWFRDGSYNVQMSIVDNGSVKGQLALGYTFQTYNFAPSYSQLIQGSVGIGTTATTATLTVVGTAYITGVTTITNTTNASSTNSGAIINYGGHGIGGNLYVGGAIYSSGTQITAVSPPINLTASQGQTTFVVSGGYSTVTMVFANGVLLNQNDYIASTSPNVILNTARNAGDTITIVFGQSVATPISQIAASAAMAMVLGM